MSNQVRVMLSRTHSHIPNGGRISSKSVAIWIRIFSNPNPNGEILHVLIGIGSPLTPLVPPPHAPVPRDGNRFETHGYMVYKPIPTRSILNPHMLPTSGTI